MGNRVWWDVGSGLGSEIDDGGGSETSEKWSKVRYTVPVMVRLTPN